MSALSHRRDAASTRERIVAAAIESIRERGFAATKVDEICAAAGVTKGAFFHHFRSKDEIGKAAVEAWCEERVKRYAADLGDADDDPLLRLHRWLDGLVRSVRDPQERPVCVLGMMAQELGGSHEALREICETKLRGWTSLVAGLLAAAKETHPPRVDFDPEQVAWMLNSLWQGSLLVAKTCRDRERVAENLEHARAYLDSLFGAEPQ